MSVQQQVKTIVLYTVKLLTAEIVQYLIIRVHDSTWCEVGKGCEGLPIREASFAWLQWDWLQE